MDVILCIVIVVPGPITTVLGPRYHVTSPADTVQRQQQHTHTHTHISLVYCSAQLCTTQLFPASLFTVSVVLSVPNSFVVCLTHTVYVNTLTSPSLVSPFLYFVLLVFPRPCLLSPAGHDAFLILSA